MRMTKAAFVLAVALSLSVPALASPRHVQAGVDDPGIVSRIFRQIRHFILVVFDEPSVPIPNNG